jgi:hypothetical protein
MSVSMERANITICKQGIISPSTSSVCNDVSSARNECLAVSISYEPSNTGIYNRTTGNRFITLCGMKTDKTHEHKSWWAAHV